MEKHDLLIVVDATGSMTEYLASLNTSLPQIISISALTGCFSRVGVVAYRDYTYVNDTIKFSGWLGLEPEDDPAQQPNILEFAKGLRPQGNRDWDEAAKTGLAKAYEVMRFDAKTIILFYTDAPPHTIGLPRGNTDAEIEALSRPGAYGGSGLLFVDWISAARTLATGEKKAQVFAMLYKNMPANEAGYYNFLCQMTDGACIHLENTNPETISKASVELLLTWMGVEKPTTGEHSVGFPGTLSYYVSTQGIDDLSDESDKGVGPFLSVPYTRQTSVTVNVQDVSLNTALIYNRLSKKITRVQSPAELWDTTDSYRKVATEHMMRIIDSDVCAIAVNPVFGTLWRAICKDRSYGSRDALVNAFSQAVGRIDDPMKKKTMQTWLEESYNFSAEIQAIIDTVPEVDQYPCVLLDPTMSFAQEVHGSSADGWGTFTRGELLEISRSCEADILRRLGRILTRLTYVEDASAMPEHLARSNVENVRRIPIALATEKHSNQFWKILLHTVVPGTQLMPRAAALLAALSVRMGVTFMADIAEQEVLRYRDHWRNIEVPETWSMGCLRLLLDADKAYQQSCGGLDKPVSLLTEADALLFRKLLAYKTLEHNLDISLTIQKPWTPHDADYPLGPLATCKLCQLPRSVTIMGSDGQCGLCLCSDPTRPEQSGIAAEPSTDIASQYSAKWVECRVSSCRAQYVVYNPESRRVSPKCHYCRQRSIPGLREEEYIAPVVECSKCTNRVIWPEEYRSACFDVAAFVCTPCEIGRQTLVEVETTANDLTLENSFSWLAQDTDQPDKSPFLNRSIFYIVSTMGPDEFMRRITFFPTHSTPLTHKGKKIHNVSAIISKLKTIVTSGRGAAKADCSLCFASFWRSSLSSACGRNGCNQRICNSCTNSWYGMNKSGSIINTAALACPFCRRFPAPRTLSKYGQGIHAVQNLKDAIANHGTWIYAWCMRCSGAKEFASRDCARGMPPEVTNWECESCTKSRETIQEAYNRMKPCPKCGTMTEKVSGCGHIECPVEGCGIHWCYFCGKEAVHGRIYEHMAEEHGGAYGYEWEDDY